MSEKIGYFCDYYDSLGTEIPLEFPGRLFISGDAQLTIGGLRLVFMKEWPIPEGWQFDDQADCRVSRQLGSKWVADGVGTGSNFPLCEYIADAEREVIEFPLKRIGPRPAPRAVETSLLRDGSCSPDPVLNRVARQWPSSLVAYGPTVTDPAAQRDDWLVHSTAIHGSGLGPISAPTLPVALPVVGGENQNQFLLQHSQQLLFTQNYNHDHISQLHQHHHHHQLQQQQQHHQHQHHLQTWPQHHLPRSSAPLLEVSRSAVPVLSATRANSLDPPGPFFHAMPTFRPSPWDMKTAARGASSLPAVPLAGGLPPAGRASFGAPTVSPVRTRSRARSRQHVQRRRPVFLLDDERPRPQQSGNSIGLKRHEGRSRLKRGGARAPAKGKPVAHGSSATRSDHKNKRKMARQSTGSSRSKGPPPESGGAVFHDQSSDEDSDADNGSPPKRPHSKPRSDQRTNNVADSNNRNKVQGDRRGKARRGDVSKDANGREQRDNDFDSSDDTGSAGSETQDEDSGNGTSEGHSRATSANKLDEPAVSRVARPSNERDAGPGQTPELKSDAHRRWAYRRPKTTTQLAADVASSSVPAGGKNSRRSNAGSPANSPTSSPQPSRVSQSPSQSEQAVSNHHVLVVSEADYDSSPVRGQLKRSLSASQLEEEGGDRDGNAATSSNNSNNDSVDTAPIDVSKPAISGSDRSCPRCGARFSTLPSLRHHLYYHWTKKGKDCLTKRPLTSFVEGGAGN